MGFNLDRLGKKEVVLKSGVRIQYNAFSPQKLKIEPRNGNRKFDTIEGDNLTIIGNKKTANYVSLSGNDCIVKGVDHLQFFGNRGTVYATPKQDRFEINSDGSTKVYNLGKKDKVNYSNYIAEEPGFFTRLKEDLVEGITSNRVENNPFSFKSQTFVIE